MDWGLVLISIVAVVFAWHVTTAWRWLMDVFGRRSGQGERTSGHHAVTIVPGESACEQARRMAQTRVLAQDAPVLPLENCNVAVCGCVYRHFEDRRLVQRRAPVHVRMVKSNRRTNHEGRRVEDRLVAG